MVREFPWRMTVSVPVVLLVTVSPLQLELVRVRERMEPDKV